MRSGEELNEFIGCGGNRLYYKSFSPFFIKKKKILFDFLIHNSYRSRKIKNNKKFLIVSF